MAVTSQEREAAIKLSRSPAFSSRSACQCGKFTCKRKSTAKVPHGQQKVWKDKKENGFCSNSSPDEFYNYTNLSHPLHVGHHMAPYRQSGFMPPSLFTFFPYLRVCGEGLFQPLQMPTFSATRQDGGENRWPATGYIFVSEHLQINEVAVSGDAINVSPVDLKQKQPLQSKKNLHVFLAGRLFDNDRSNVLSGRLFIKAPPKE
jgi:hypothetical protein